MRQGLSGAGLPPAEQLRANLVPLAEAPGSPNSLSSEYLEFYGMHFAPGREGLSHRLGTIASGEFQLAVHHFQQPGADRTLLLVHGYLDHSGLYGHLIEYGLGLGWDVLIFDLPGHGLSTGEKAAIDDFAHYAQAIQDVVVSLLPAEAAVVAIGQSTGCSALMECARSSRFWPFREAVFLAPLIEPVGWRWIKPIYRVLGKFTDSVPRGFKVNSGDEQFSEFLRSDPLQSHRLPLVWLAALDRWLARLGPVDLGSERLLVVQGDRDTTVRWRHNLQFLQQLFPGYELFMLRGARHHLANETRALREQYLSQIDQFLSG